MNELRRYVNMMWSINVENISSRWNNFSLRPHFWASLWVFPKTRRSPRKKRRSQDWSEDLKIDQNLRDQIELLDIKLSKLVNTTENICYFWILTFDHISLRFDKGVNSGLQSLPRNNIRKSKIKKTNICKEVAKKTKPWVPIERLYLSFWSLAWKPGSFNYHVTKL